MRNLEVKLTAVMLFLCISVYSSMSSPSNFCPGPEEKSTIDKRFNFANAAIPNVEAVDKALVSQHFLGEDVAVLSYIIQKNYVTKKTDYSGASTEIVIEKPAIYNAIQTMNKQFKKAVKKGEYTQQEAELIFADCLKKSYSLFFEDTKELEKLMKEMNSLEQYIALFNCISFK